MSQLLIYIVLIIFLPILLLVIFLEKRARRVMLSFLCGVIVCLCAYYINTFLYRKTGLDNEIYTFTLGALIEESLKFIPLLLFCLILKKGKRQTIAMSFALGVGFCVVENFFYLMQSLQSANLAWIFLRCIGTGLMHSMSATFIGFGLYKTRIRENKKAFINGTVTMLIAILYHALFNFLTALDEVKIIGAFIPFVSYIILSLILKKDAIKAFFDDKESDAEKIENI